MLNFMRKSEYPCLLKKMRKIQYDHRLEIKDSPYGQKTARRPFLFLNGRRESMDFFYLF